MIVSNTARNLLNVSRLGRAMRAESGILLRDLLAGALWLAVRRRR